MKYLIILLLALVSIKIKAQNVYDIREAIAESSAGLHTQKVNVFRILNKEISSGEYSIPVRVYYPTNQDSLPILFHIHGGAWIGGNLDTHDNICRRLAIETNSIVIAIDYRRPPEYQYPTALNDCLFILGWINENKEMLKSDGKLFLIGDSAGGGLVPSVIIKNLSTDTPVKIDGQILINPATDLRIESNSYEQYKLFIDLYVPSNVDKSNPFISPLVSDKFNKLPKSIIVVSENDKIKNEGILFHNKMVESDNSSVLFELKGTGHLAGDWAGNSGLANSAVEFVSVEFKKWTSQ